MSKEVFIQTVAQIQVLGARKTTLYRRNRLQNLLTTNHFKNVRPRKSVWLKTHMTISVHARCASNMDVSISSRNAETSLPVRTSFTNTNHIRTMKNVLRCIFTLHFATPNKMIHTTRIYQFMKKGPIFADKTFTEAELRLTKNVKISKQITPLAVNLRIPRDLTQTLWISYVWDLWEKLYFELISSPWPAELLKRRNLRSNQESSLIKFWFLLFRRSMLKVT